MISERIRPGNPVFVFIAILTPWNLLNTYIDVNGQQIIVSRYYQETKHRRRKRKDVFDISEVIAIGWPNELGISIQEAKVDGRYGTYAAQEIDFLLKSGEIIPFNAKPYTKKQCRRLLSLFSCEKKKRLSKALGL
ncbi:MAG: hypothetical protein PHQ72_09545 [Hespellia sp.]|nr:hypothetical protein [Hespellia sp.]